MTRPGDNGAGARAPAAPRTSARRPLASPAETRSEASAPDRWTLRARPGFLYVMYALLLWSIPVGLIAAFHPAAATRIAAGMSAYLNAIPEPLYAVFGTAYLGYTVAREWGKTKAP